MGQTAISGFYKIREIVVVVSSVIGMLTSNTELTCSQYKKKNIYPTNHISTISGRNLSLTFAFIFIFCKIFSGFKYNPTRKKRAYFFSK